MASQKDRKTAWNRAAPVAGKNSDVWRRDAQGNVIRNGSYGTHGKYGWEVDHIKPQAKGGSDNMNNLQALQTKANRRKSDKY